jgi:hypothetical protein
MKNEQKLIVESWRKFVVEQQTQQAEPEQPQKQMTPIEKIVYLSRQKITQPGPSEETKKAINDPNTIRNLEKLISNKDVEGAINYLLSNVMKDGDNIEVTIPAVAISNASKSKVQELKKPGPIGQALGKTAKAADKAVTAAEKGLTSLGNGDLNAGITKFSSSSATMVLGGMILANLMSVLVTKDFSALQDTLDLVPHLKQSLAFTDPKGLAKLLQPQPASPVVSENLKESFHYDGKEFDSMQAVEDYKAEKEENVVDPKKGLSANYPDIADERKIKSAKQILKKAIEQLDSLNLAEAATLDDGTLVCEACLLEVIESSENIILEAKYQGRTVQLNKPMKGDVKKSKVYVKDPKTGNVKKVNFGDKNMKIKKSNPKRRKSFRARHNCENPGPKTKARYWSCKAW